jgi:hypothetical protein
MSLLDKASLIVTPNAYKESKLYSVIPSSGLGDMTVVRATTATRVNSLGLIQSVAVNIPRIDYTNGSCPSLLVEPQRTNLALYSEQFDNAYWIKDIDVTVNSNFSISPSGNLDADRVNFASNNKAIYKNITATGAHRFSIYLKGEGANIGKQIQLLIGNVGGTINVTLTNQWQRFNTDASTSTYVGVAKIGALQADSVLIWGAQLEAGAYATSYIPTVASTVTRNADVISKTGITDLIGQTEGTLFYDIDLKSRVSYNYIAINNGTATNYIGIYITPTNLQLETYVASILQTAIIFTNSSTGRFKIAAGYKNNDFVLYVNGNLIGTDLIGSVPTCNKLDLTAFNQANSIGFNSVQLYKTKLSNTELQSLTTL